MIIRNYLSFFHIQFLKIGRRLSCFWRFFCLQRKSTKKYGSEPVTKLTYKLTVRGKKPDPFSTKDNTVN